MVNFVEGDFVSCDFHYKGVTATLEGCVLQNPEDSMVLGDNCHLVSFKEFSKPIYVNKSDIKSISKFEENKNTLNYNLTDGVFKSRHNSDAFYSKINLNVFSKQKEDSMERKESLFFAVFLKSSNSNILLNIFDNEESAKKYRSNFNKMNSAKSTIIKFQGN